MKHKFFLAFIFCSISFSTLNAQTLTGDPWIFQAYKEMYNRQPNALEINIKNYNSGSWNNYGELKQYIQQFQTSCKDLGITVSTAFVKNVAVIGLRQNGQQVAVAALSLNGGKIVANDGATIISGTVNIISGGAGNLIGQDGAGIAINKNMGGISFGGSYTVQSENTRVVKSGKGALIINRKN